MYMDIGTAENRIYLAYGSNLNREQMAWRCPYATVVGPIRLEGFRLLFRGYTGSAVATIEPDENFSVPALLWEITPRCEEALDRYEGWPRLYRKEWLTVPFGEKETDALVYVMNEGPPLGRPGRGYLGAILAGYKSAGFDRAVLEEAIEASRPQPGGGQARVSTGEDRRLKWR